MNKLLSARDVIRILLEVMVESRRGDIDTIKKMKKQVSENPRERQLFDLMVDKLEGKNV